MSQKITTQINKFQHHAFVSIMIKMNDDGKTDLKTALGISARNQITSIKFIRACHIELSRFKSHHEYTEKNLEYFYGFKFVRYESRKVKNHEEIYFQDEPRWNKNVIFLNIRKR
jgi:hypothetical protein